MSDDKAAVQPESEESLSDNQAETPQQTDPKKVADDPSVDEATDTGPVSYTHLTLPTIYSV